MSELKYPDLGLIVERDFSFVIEKGYFMRKLTCISP
jgi:hypothetical protein